MLALPTNWRRKSFGSLPYLLRKRPSPLSTASLHAVYNEHQYNYCLRTTACYCALEEWRCSLLKRAASLCLSLRRASPDRALDRRTYSFCSEVSPARRVAQRTTSNSNVAAVSGSLDTSDWLYHPSRISLFSMTGRGRNNTRCGVQDEAQQQAWTDNDATVKEFQ